LSIRSQTVSKALALGFGLIFIGTPAAIRAQQASTPQTTESHTQTQTDGYRALVPRVWQTVQDRYYDPKFRGLDWQSYQKIYVQRSYAKPEQAYQAAQELLSKLQDRYTRFLAPAQFQKVAVPSVGLVDKEFGPVLETKALSGVGYLKLNRFNPQAASQMAQAIQDFQGQDVAGFILDLRDNRGGLFDSAVQIAQQWLGAGLVAQVYGREGQKQIEVQGQPLTQLPLVVLVNQSSGSASEILAGVLQERGRAKIVGLKTFGKASIQTVFTEKDGSGFFITTAHYLLPSGKDIDHQGIQPDIVVFDGSRKSQDPSLARALTLFQKKL
jgi:C-terminal processing protease CtpA/Prc